MSGTADVVAAAPSDALVRQAVLAGVAALTTAHVRPNKLRKIVCQRVPGTDWNQYRRIVDALVAQGSLRTRTVDQERVLLSNDGALASAPSSSSPTEEEEETRQPVLTEILEVPFAIILHLTKKGHRKKKNVEVNTKTKVVFDDDTNEALWSNKSVEEVERGGILMISKTVVDEEHREQAEKQLKAAKHMVSQMVKAFRDNPERFVVARAGGGTLAEQKAERKRKTEAVSHNKRGGSGGSGRDHKKQQHRTEDKDESEDAPKKSKHRKFF